MFWAKNGSLHCNRTPWSTLCLYGRTSAFHCLILLVNGNKKSMTSVNVLPLLTVMSSFTLHPNITRIRFLSSNILQESTIKLLQDCVWSRCDKHWLIAAHSGNTPKDKDSIYIKSYSSDLLMLL